VPPTATPVPVAATATVGDQALGLVSFDWRSLGYNITFHTARPGLRGLTYTQERRIEIYVRPSDTASGLAHVIAHEIGHAVDIERNSAADRAQWLATRGAAADHPWWPGQLDDFSSGAGDFAECFASWTVGSPSYSRLAGGCDTAAIGLVAQLSAG